MVGETRDVGVGGIGGDGGLQPDFWGPPTCQCWGDPCHRGSQAWCSCRSNGGRVPQLPANPPLPLQHSVWAGGVLTVGFVQAGQCLLPCQSSSRPSHTLAQRRTHEYTDPDTSRAHPLSSISSQASQASHHLISQRQPLHCLLFALFWALHNLHSKLRMASAPFAQSTTCLQRPGSDQCTLRLTQLPQDFSGKPSDSFA